MSDEIHSACKLTATKNLAAISASIGFTRDMTGAAMLQTTQLIGTAGEAIVFGDITGAPGCVQLRNLDSTNFILIALDSAASTQVFCKLMPLESAQFQPATGTLYAKANVANALMGVLAVEL